MALRRERVLLFGAGPLASKLAEEVEARPGLRWEIAGVVDDNAAAAALQPRLLGTTRDLERVMREAAPDRIVVTLTARRGRLPVDALLEARVRGIVVEDGASVYERLTGKLAIEALTPSALIFSSDVRPVHFDVRARCALSVALAAAGLVALLPLLVLVALAIVIDSPGPVFFLHERVGHLGRRFSLIKFRTMHPTRGRRSEWERDNGDRITRVGKWLRRFRLDELPQFWNVLRGDMNLVGPRPHPVCNFRLFAQKIPYYSLRCAVRPGITGWAQVRYGYANNLEEETEKMRYDLYYVRHVCFGLDVKILFDTLRAVGFGRGVGRAMSAAAETGRWKPAPPTPA